MITFKQIYNFLIIIVIFFLSVYGTSKVLINFENKIDSLLLEQYKVETKTTKENIENLINVKLKSTMAIALSYAQGDLVLQSLSSKNTKSLKKNIDELSLKLRQYSDYKNVWIQIIDKDGISLARTWTDKSGDSLLKIRKDIVKIINDPKPTQTISIGNFTLSFKAIVPIYDKQHKLIGFIEAITHFNSIVKKLEKIGYTSVVLADKSYQKQLTHALTKQFIDGYYIANFDIHIDDMMLIKNIGVKEVISNNNYVLNSNNIISALHIKDLDNSDLAYYIFIKNTKQFDHKKIDNFTSYVKYIIFFIIFTALLSLGILYKYKYDTEKQKIYFRRVIDSTVDIVIITDTIKPLDANKAFFDYFEQYKTLAEFNEANGCICDLFIKENGYLHKNMNGLTWVEYVNIHPEINHKVKIVIGKKISIFYLNIQKLHKRAKDIYTVVLTDMTEIELYKEKLEKLSKTDALTKIGNRYHFMNELEKEFIRTQRYKENISLVMLDIDHFKAINDTYGHDAGDTALVTLAHTVTTLLRESDIFCRYGGEEFMIIMTNCSAKQAEISAQRIRKSIESLQIKTIESITISIGITQLKEDDSVELMIKRADEAMYTSKENGRNRVTVK